MAKIALVQDCYVEYIGYMYISAVLKEAGHTVEVFIGTEFRSEKLIKSLKKFNPDVVGFSVLSPSETFSLQIGKRIKEETQAITIYGNVHIMMNRDIIEKPGVDIICIGEGELPILELCNCIDAKKPYYHIKGLWFSTPEGEIIKNDKPEIMLEINDLPYHDRSIYDKYAFFRYSKYLRVGLGRGCPFQCSFCSNPSLAKHYGGAKTYIRKLTPQRAVDELDYVVSQRKKVDFILITDEVLWVRNEWLREFLTIYKERLNIPFTGNFRFGAIQEEDIKLLAEAGCQNLVVAVESGDEKQRMEMMNKPVKDEHILQVCEWLHKYKIKFVSSVFFGLPGDTVEDHIERLKFYQKIKPTYVWSTFFQPYAGLSLTENPAVQKYLPKNKEFEATLHHDMYLDLPDRERLVRLKHVYFLCIAFPWMTKPLVYLTKYNIPFIFQFLFSIHFSYYALTFEKISIIQWFTHIKTFGIESLIIKLVKFFESFNNKKIPVTNFTSSEK